MLIQVFEYTKISEYSSINRVCVRFSMVYNFRRHKPVFPFCQFSARRNAECFLRKNIRRKNLAKLIIGVLNDRHLPLNQPGIDATWNKKEKHLRNSYKYRHEFKFVKSGLKSQTKKSQTSMSCARVKFIWLTLFLPSGGTLWRRSKMSV